MKIYRKKKSVESHDTLCPEEEKENSIFKGVKKGMVNPSPIFLNKLWQFTDKKESVESHDSTCPKEEKDNSE